MILVRFKICQLQAQVDMSMERVCGHSQALLLLVKEKGWGGRYGIQRSLSAKVDVANSFGISSSLLRYRSDVEGISWGVASDIGPSWNG